MVKRINTILFIVTFLYISGCFTLHSADLYRFTGNEEIKILGFASDKKGAFCEDFRLTTEQVRTFFKKAKKITSFEVHNEFQWLPCYVYGSIIDNGQKYEWEIRLIGICKLVTPTGEIVWLGCKNCDEIF